MILSLFFTRGVSLELWVNQGLLAREKLIYEKHLEHGNLEKVYWFTYGSNDKKLAEQLKKNNELHKDIEVYDMPKIFNISKVGSYLYSLFLPFYYKNILKQSNVIKTNQMDGAWSGVISHLFLNTKLIARTGYTLSQLEYSKNKNSLRFKWYCFIERITYKNCDKAIVASEHNRNYLLENKYLNADKIEVIKNFIDIETFKQLNLKRYKNRILFVGRLNKEKNLFNLIEAIGNTSFILDIYGQGSLMPKLKNFANTQNAEVNFMGVVSNLELAKIYNKYQYYILPSLFEGMPKTLLEAMACGCICIGTNVSGINEVITDQIDGLLCNDVSSQSILKTLNMLEGQDFDMLSLNAISKIESFFSLNNMAELDIGVINKLCK